MYFAGMVFALCIGMSLGQEDRSTGALVHPMHLYCTGRPDPSHSQRTTQERGGIGKKGPRGPPGVVDYQLVNETIKEYLGDISVQIQAGLSEIRPTVQNNNRVINELRAKSESTEAKLSEFSPDLEKCMADMEEMRAEMQQVQKKLTVLATWFKASNNYYYKVFPDESNYTTAKANCESHGARLASAGIRDQNVYRQLLPIFQANGKSYIWVGLNDIQVENRFVWEDGAIADINPSMWKRSEPNNAGGGEDCVELHWDPNWKLNDDKCRLAKKYLCEMRI